MRKALAIAVLLLVPVAAHGQSTDLQALGQQYAQQYRIPWSLFDAQIQAESSWNPDVGCNGAACGIAQFLPSTAAQFGLDPSNAQQSLQAAAKYDQQLYNQTGSWTGALTVYSGGLTPSSPGDYGPVFAAAAAADGGGTPPQQPGITVAADPSPSGGSLAAAAEASGATASARNAFNPFTDLWTQYNASIAAPLQSEVSQIQTMIQPYVLVLVILMLISLGITTFAGRMVASDLFYRALRIAVVVPFTAAGSTWYQDYVINLFKSLPTTFSNGIIGTTSSNPAAGFDIVLHAFGESVANVWWSIPSWHVSTMIGDGMLIALAALIVYVATALMFAVWIVAQALLALLLTIGPLIILALLFDYMRGWFDRWIAAMLLMVLVTLTADLISAVVLKVILGAMNALPITGQATQDTLNLLGVAMVVVVLAGALALLPAVLQFLAAAAGVPAMNHAQHLLSAAVYRPATSIATGSLRRVVK